MSQDDWIVEQMGSEENRVEMKMRDGAGCEKVLRLENYDDEVVEIRVDDGVGEVVGDGVGEVVGDGVGEVVGDRDPAEWVEAVADRIGVRLEW
ncbi:hypothetical protein [Halolamina salifodinae]|uniref:Uncharacterized protein n=1 Tax=Halolamina salifodinae TaxID=1202767 RepID=A0A8T4GWE6_9EURY|nr:hypothetical protein [Halolamina salifodinae]MBP1987219.1 hypothetical protein [Halolamina salifodinae]